MVARNKYGSKFEKSVNVFDHINSLKEKSTIISMDTGKHLTKFNDSLYAKKLKYSGISST